MNLYDFPTDVKAIPIGQKRKAGRPKQTLESLDKQPGEQVTDSSDEDTYEDYLDIPINKQNANHVNISSNIIYDNDQHQAVSSQHVVEPQLNSKRSVGRPKKTTNSVVTTKKSTREKRVATSSIETGFEKSLNKRRRV